MNKAELTEIVRAFEPSIRRFVADAIRPLADDLTALKARQPMNGKDGVGVSGAMIDRDSCLILTLSDGRMQNLGVVVGGDGQDGIPGRDGKDIAPEDFIDAMQTEIEARVERHIANLPTIKGEPGQDGVDGKDGEPGRDGKDGRDGIDGKDGAPGIDGKDADPEAIIGIVSAELDAKLADAVAKIPTVQGDAGAPGPKGEPGLNGKDGEPGLGFEDLEEEVADEGRILIRRYKRGSQVKEFRHRLSVMLDRGVYADGKEYDPGDGVTWAGSFWICQRTTATKPGTGDAWRLAVKRGRDGKDGEKGPKGDPGTPPKDSKRQ